MKRKMTMLFLLHILVALWVGAGWQKELCNISFSGKELETEMGIYEPGGNGSGLYIDDSMGMNGRYAASPKTDLKKGTYLITIEYKAEAEGQTYGVTSSQPGYRIITGLEKRRLRPEKEAESFYVWLDRAAEEYQVYLDYNGSGSFLVRGIEIRQTNGFFLMRVFLGLCLLAAVDGIAAARKRKWLRPLTAEDKTVWVGVAVTTVVASIPLFSYYLLTGHDLPFHLLRIEGIKDGLLGGQFPVRIQPGWFDGQGYAASVFYGDLFLYFPAAMRAFGFPLQTAYKTFVVLVNLVTCAGACYCFDRICGNKYAALAGSIVYTLTPYRLGNIYIRAAVGEYTAMVFLPFIAAGLFAALRKESSPRSVKESVFLLTVGFSGIIQSHMITCEMTAFFTILVCAVFVRRIFAEGRWKVLLCGALLTLGINLWFILPFLEYSFSGRFQVVQVGGMPQIQTYCAFVSQLFDVFPNGSGSAYSVYERLQGNRAMPLTVGFILMWSVGAFVLYCVQQKKQEEERTLGILCALLAGLALWMATIVFPWDSLAEAGKIPALLIRNLQYGWRMLSMASILLSIMTVCLVSMLDRRNHSYGRLLIGTYCAAGLLLGGWMTSVMMRDGTEEIYRDRSEVKEEYVTLLEYVPNGTNRERFVETMPVPGEGITIQEYGNDRGNVRIRVENLRDSEGSVLLPVLNYDGYAAKNMQGEGLEIQNGDNNRIQLVIPAGYVGEITVRFEEPFLWRVGEGISLICLAWAMMAGPGRFRQRIRYRRDGEKERA